MIDDGKIHDPWLLNLSLALFVFKNNILFIEEKLQMRHRSDNATYSTFSVSSAALKTVYKSEIHSLWNSFLSVS